MWGAQTSSDLGLPACVDEGLRLVEARRHRLLHEHVLAGREGGQREVAVLVHVGQDEDDVEIVPRDQRLGVGEVGVDTGELPDRVPFGGIGVERGDQLDASLVGELVDDAAIGSPEHAPEPENPDS